MLAVMGKPSVGTAPFGVPTPVRNVSDEPGDASSSPAPVTLPTAFSPDSVDWEEWRGDWPFIHHAIAGSFAGVMEHLAMYPVDTIKTRMQAFRGTARASQQPRQPPSSAPVCPTSHIPGDSGHCLDGALRTCADKKGDMWPERPSNSVGRITSGVGQPRGLSGLTLQVPMPRNVHSAAAIPSPLRSVGGVLSGKLRISGSAVKSPSWQAFVNEGSRQRSAAKMASSVISKVGSKGVTVRTDLLGDRVLAREVLGSSRRSAATSVRAGGELVAEMRGSARVLRGSSGLVSGLRSVYVEGGFRGLYRGAGAVVAGCVPAHACYFMSYEFVKDRMLARARKRQRQQCQPPSAAADTRTAESGEELTESACEQRRRSGDASKEHCRCSKQDKEQDTHSLTHVELLACGMCATLSHDLILTPVDVVKQRMQLGCFRSLGNCVTATLRHEGPLAFVRSLPVSLLLNLPHGATLVYANETLKSRLTSNQTSSPTTSLSIYFFCAGVSGGVAGFISNPLDVVKTRLQTQDCAMRDSSAELAGSTKTSPCPLGPCPPKYHSLFGTVKTIWLEEGLQGFWRGVSSRVCLCIPATAICWGSYETFKFLWHVSARGS